jgi:hypothetical protein
MTGGARGRQGVSTHRLLRRVQSRPHHVTSCATICSVSSLVKHRARLAARETTKERKSASRVAERRFSHAHRQLRSRPSRGPFLPVSRPLRQAGPAAPRARAPQNPDNAGTSCHAGSRAISRQPRQRPRHKTSRVRDSPSVDTDRIRPPAHIRRRRYARVLPEAGDVSHLYSDGGDGTRAEPRGTMHDEGRSPSHNRRVA